MTNETTAIAQRMELERDLRTQIGEMSQENAPWVFREWSPGRVVVTLYSMETGEKIQLPRYQAESAMRKRLPSGEFMFTTDAAKAPPEHHGSTRCFLAVDSPERKSGLLDEAGIGHLAPCPAQKLGSMYSKRQHAQNRHGQSWAMLQEYLAEKTQAETDARQEQMTSAMMQLASRGIAPVEDFTCDVCGITSKSAAGLAAHKRSHITAEAASLE